MIDNAKLQPSVDAMFAFYRDRRLTWLFARQNCRSPSDLIIDNRTGVSFSLRIQQVARGDRSDCLVPCGPFVSPFFPLSSSALRCACVRGLRRPNQPTSA